MKGSQCGKGGPKDSDLSIIHYCSQSFKLAFKNDLQDLKETHEKDMTASPLSSIHLGQVGFNFLEILLSERL